MQTVASLLLALIAATLVARAASEIQCYVCNSLVDKECNTKPVRSDYLVNCSIGRSVGIDNVSLSTAQVCWKQSQDIDGLAIVDRTCGPRVDTTSYSCYDRVGTKKIKVNYCICNQPGCNPGNRLDSSWALVALACSLATLLLSSAALRQH